MSEEGKLKRGEMYNRLLTLNKDLPKDKKLTVPKQVSFEHEDVLFFLSKQEKLTDPPKAEPKVSKKESKD